MQYQDEFSKDFKLARVESCRLYVTSRQRRCEHCGFILHGNETECRDDRTKKYARLNPDKAHPCPLVTTSRSVR